jgi:hypothetical protein
MVVVVVVVVLVVLNKKLGSYEKIMRAFSE